MIHPECKACGSGRMRREYHPACLTKQEGRKAVYVTSLGTPHIHDFCLECGHDQIDMTDKPEKFPQKPKIRKGQKIKKFTNDDEEGSLEKPDWNT